ASLVVIVSLCIVFSPALSWGMTGDSHPGSTAPGIPDVSDPDSPGDESDSHAYSLASLTARRTSYAELSQTYGDLFADFVPFEFAQNATCGYTVYSLGNIDVLVRAEIGCLDAFNRFEAEVYTDVSEGKYYAEELVPYRAHASSGGYRCKTEYVNGEYVSQIYWQGSAERFADFTSPNDYGAGMFMEYFLR
ncbi:MAG: hypothetical protein K2H43_05080, partial [Clostridia bacterium]|nr:hypothetical protein [Clostridia bacterium]